MKRLFVPREIFFTFILLLVPALTLCIAGLSEGYVTPGVSSSFDPGPGVDGWTCQAGDCSNPGSGGATDGESGDGYFKYSDIGGGVTGFVFAPEKFLGDYSQSEDLTLEYDAKVFQMGASITRNLSIHFYSGDYKADYNSGISVSGATDWIHVVVPLDFASPGWNVAPGFDPTNIDRITVPGDWVDGKEILGYDNFFIGPLDIAPPRTISLCPPFAEPGDTIRIWGKNFGDVQGDICLGKRCLGNEKLVVEDWTNDYVDFVVPTFNCRAFEDKNNELPEDYKPLIRRKIVIIRNGETSNPRLLEIFTPLECIAAPQ